MTTAPPQLPAPATAQQAQLWDMAQPFRGEVPAQLTTDVVDTAAGQRAGLSVRVPNTTVTVLLVKDDLDTWIEQLVKLRGRMNGLIIPTGG